MLVTRPYLEQVKQWPRQGKHILAQYDDHSVVVYQAYRPAIGEFAVQNGFFGGPFSYTRMSWIKPNFLWMMYRSQWGCAPGQEIILAVRLRRGFFDEILAAAVASSFDSNVYQHEQAWRSALQRSAVRLQWDPDHAPSGGRVNRRAIQLGLRHSMLARYGKTEPMDIINVCDFVAEQRVFAHSGRHERLVTPREEVYRPDDAGICRRLGLSDTP